MIPPVRRACGILLHPTSLPGPRPRGGLGPPAHAFVDLLAAAGAGVWQTLPLTVPGAHRSPYDGRSAFALDPDLLPPDRIREGTDLDAFREREHDWLDDWALFAALDERLGSPWSDWPIELRDRRPAALAAARRDLERPIAAELRRQWWLDRELDALRRHARSLGVRLAGDLPIYVAHHSADVWAHRDLFELDADGRPAAAAGVPPDAFSESGQLWGHPLYRWRRHRESGFAWWRRRFRVAARRCDLLRLDHFRAYVAAWRVPLPADDARDGRWVPGPGQRLFDAVAPELAGLELYAEDLGHLTEPVHRLRRELGLPGTRVLQFAFDDGGDEHLPEAYPPATVATTGTHDNDTLVGWLSSLDPPTAERVAAWLGAGLDDPVAAARAAIDRLLRSAAELTVLPAQDLLELGSGARMNVPGEAEGNWSWRLDDGALDGAVVDRLRGALEASDRVGGDGVAGDG